VTLRSCRWRSMRRPPTCCACVTLSTRPVVAISAAIAMIRVVFMNIPFVLKCDPRSDRSCKLFSKELRAAFGSPGPDVPALVDLVELDEVALGAPADFSAPDGGKVTSNWIFPFRDNIDVDTEFVNADVGRLFYARGMDGVFQGPLGWRRAAVVFSTRPETR
jgi:hypothetical protein